MRCARGFKRPLGKGLSLISFYVNFARLSIGFHVLFFLFYGILIAIFIIGFTELSL